MLLVGRVYYSVCGSESERGAGGPYLCVCLLIVVTTAKAPEDPGRQAGRASVALRQLEIKASKASRSSHARRRPCPPTVLYASIGVQVHQILSRSLASPFAFAPAFLSPALPRSEERRVGKECRN